MENRQPSDLPIFQESTVSILKDLGESPRKPYHLLFRCVLCFELPPECGHFSSEYQNGKYPNLSRIKFLSH